MTEQANNGAAAGQEEQGAQFSLQRIYVRDLSFEAPKSPEIFRQEWNPSVALDLNTKQKSLEGDFHEVVLKSYNFCYCNDYTSNRKKFQKDFPGTIFLSM